MAVAELPSVVARLPTTTQPLFNTTSAVVRPTPPGHIGTSEAITVAKTLIAPLGESWTIVVPVPWKFELALKLLTNTSPFTRWPVVRGTTAMPIGIDVTVTGDG
jgi:hypothetical protein